AYNGYTIMSVPGQGAVLVDMNGNVVKTWVDFQGFPNKLLPNGNVMGSLGTRDSEYGYQDMTDVTQVDWDGNIVWSFNKKELCKDGEQEYWLARQHHDYQREGNPVGYYVPGMECSLNSGKTLILGHEDLYNHRISDKRLLDDCIFEVDWEGNILWQWNAHKHFNEMNFSEQAKNVLFRNPNTHPNGGGQSDWVHINSASYLGPNKWYDEGDERFHPDNIIWDSREANIIAIISRETGKIVWQVGPDFTVSKELRAMGQIIGLHHAHMIPRGLPGEGNILLFDNGGWAGYGYPGRTSKDGTKSDIREYSRVLEFDPVTLKVVWEFTGAVWPGMAPFVNKSKFFSPLISSAQRLPNGNTLVTEGCFLRLFEVTPEKEVVWEYIAPFDFTDAYIYRAYRYPYSYVPQLPQPEEIPVVKVDNSTFRVPGAAEGKIANQTKVAGTWGYTGRMDACVTEDKLE
ncbi:MAG: aryl-sulfate sulfotransferase, partial [Peptococcaceae bacterium]|nr:aryl-sulfate sulfotransferase [Peptococcaceae bacterium]